MTRLANYLSRLETILLRRGDITIKQLHSRATLEGASFSAEVRFLDGSRLSVSELLELGARGAPHRKHVGDRVLESEPPDLTDVLAEIDQILYPPSQQE